MITRKSSYKIARAPRFNSASLVQPSLLVTHDSQVHCASVINFSEGGLAFKLDYPYEILPETFLSNVEFKVLNRLFYSDKMRVVHTHRESEFLVIGASVVNGNNIRVEEIVNFSKARRDAEEIRREVDKEIISVRSDFKAIVLELEVFFKKFKQGLLAWQEKEKAEWFSLKQQEEETLKNLFPYFQAIVTERLQTLSLVHNELSSYEQQAHKTFFREHLHSYFLESPFAKRSYEKPQGYPGDFLAMDMIYNNDYIGDSAFGKIMNKFLTTYIPCQANIERLHFLTEKIKSISLERQAQAQIKFLSLGAGPAREIEEFILQSSDSNKTIFNCVDWDVDALNYAKKRIVLTKEKRQSQAEVHFINGDVVAMLRDNPLEMMREQDLIYSSGLFDYLSDTVGARLIQLSFSLLKEGGELIIINANRKDPSLMETEYIGEWILTRRSEKELLTLANNLSSTAKVSITKDSQGVYWYMTIQKNPS